MVGLRQELRQSQQLVMTQQLQQSIKLLQLSAQELQEFIDEELEKNPLLQRDDAESEHAGVADAEPVSSAHNDADADAGESRAQDAFDQSQSDTYRDGFEGEYAADVVESNADYSGNTSESYSASSRSGYDGDTDGEGRSLEDTLSSEESLRDFLTSQIAMEFSDVPTRALASAMIDYLDDAGYLREELEAIGKQVGAETAMVLEVLQRLQRLEPVGIFARNLEECLRIQLLDMNRLDPAMEIMLENLAMIGEGKLDQLRQLCGVDVEDFSQMIADVRRCNPKPASGFTNDAAHSVIPDVLVRRSGQDGWHIELNAEALPRVLIRKNYAAEIGTKGDKEAKRYVSEQLANASWLVKALDQRAQTIMKVAEEIVKQQDMFLMHGIRFLKPLILKDIADAIGMHESTVSRVTNNKFMATPRGTLELKYFFTSSISSAAGASEFSSKTVMYYIKEAIDAESPKNVLSDDAIVAILKRRNIDVARRTVTKYREAMHIPSSVIRRRQKGQGA